MMTFAEDGSTWQELVDLARKVQDAHAAQDQDEDVACPFCGEAGFDLIGLKGHVDHGCESYNELPLVDLRLR